MYTQVAAMTAGTSHKKAFFDGCRWGMGHSTGLLLIAFIFLGMYLFYLSIQLSTLPSLSRESKYDHFSVYALTDSYLSIVPIHPCIYL